MLQDLDIKVKKGILVLKIKDNQLASLSLDLDASYGEQSIKVNFDVNVEYNTFAMSYPLDRMAEIKQEYEKEQEEESNNPQ